MESVLLPCDPAPPSILARAILRGRAHFWCVLAACLSLLTATRIAAQRVDEDVVRLRNGISVKGTILSQDATGVRIRLAGRQDEKAYPPEEISSVDVRYAKEQLDGERLFAARNYVGAAERFDDALKVEGRPWLRARITNRLIWSHMALADPVSAMTVFASALQSPDSKLPWTAVPLWWLPDAAPDPARSQGVSLSGHKDALLAVLGSSYLLGTPQSSAARDTLTRLTRSADSHVALLARTQLWRWQVEQVTLATVREWQLAIEAMPADLRGGPQFVAGLALTRLGEYDDAALAFLWTPLAASPDERLAARGMLLAAQALEAGRQPAEARQLYEEILTRYSQTTEARTARGRLDAIKE